MRLVEVPALEPERADWQAAFELLFETTSTAVAILDERRSVVDLNPAAQRLLGRCNADATAAEVIAAVTAAERARSAAEWEQLLREGRGSGTRTLIGSDGSEVQVAFVAVIEGVAGGRRAVYTLTPEDGPASGRSGLRVAATLTKREGQVVRLIAGGLDTAEIADALHVSPNTVRSHVRNAMAKLSARTRAQLVAKALGAAGATAPVGLMPVE
jgi:PAS domain S-box-containing protein